jgi:hypothetical protein
LRRRQAAGRGHSRLAAGVEARVAVVEVGSSGLANGEGAQHHGGRVTHVDVVLIWFAGSRCILRGS